MEVIIRNFNLRDFDEVIKDLRLLSTLIIRPSLAKEEHDAKLLGEFLFEAQGCDKEIKAEFFGSNKELN